ncbi:DUF5044 domain-containing protein [Virgibacillus doumboii]|uniref:DUF5044 domain-containing protein n=1 Tax=Virgibacillus doumboii TaxID=2697503 RepID=UPI0013DF5EF9|nr:DUF5044 domain-containing protein [Virgibacillus doumboii]
MEKTKKKAILEWVLAAVLIFFVVKDSAYINYYHLSPVEAHEQSERTYHYGPSEIVEDIDLGDAHIYLAKYKDWFSANTVNRHAGIFWSPGSSVAGRKIKQNQDISHSWSGTASNEDEMRMKFYGIVTNPNITEVELDVVEDYDRMQKVNEDDIQTYSKELKEHRMFLFHWIGENHDYKWIEIRGLDENGKVVYEESLD